MKIDIENLLKAKRVLPSNQPLPRWARRKMAKADKLMKKAMNTTFLHESKYKPIPCVLCGTVMPTIHDTHNPHPLTKSTTGLAADGGQETVRCCSTCQSEQVLPARLKMMRATIDRDETTNTTPSSDRKTGYIAFLSVEELAKIPSYCEERDREFSLNS